MRSDVTQGAGTGLVSQAARGLKDVVLAPPARRGSERYRHELKFLINYGEKAALTCRMKPVFKLDPHAKNGGYCIRSLYFDDYWNTAYEEKDAGVLLRKKYRIRIYDFSDRVIKLERKKKFGQWIHKEDASLTRDEFYRILDGDYDFLLRSDQSLCREFYAECVSHVMRPRVIVDYEREPWIMDAGTVRVTFDMSMRAGICGFDIFDADLPTLPIVEPDKLIMEVKFTEFCPQSVRDIMPPAASELTAFSKYALCYEKTAYLRGFDYWSDSYASERI